MFEQNFEENLFLLNFIDLSKILCITGMHRSGTSLAASWLQACGLVIDSGRLMGAGIGNEDGHFEDEDFVDFHSRLLRENRPNSKGWIVYEDLSINSTKEDEAEIKDILKSRKENGQWGWKDPRTVAFLDLWKKECRDIKFIFLWRPAVEVVGSLVRRSEVATKSVFKIEKKTAYKTWKWYNLQVLEFCKQNPDDTILINIENLLEYDKLLFDVLKEKIYLNLNYYPLNKLVKKEFSRGKQISLKDRFYYLIFGISEIERLLEKQSLKFN